jgi:hypothetical protein
MRPAATPKAEKVVTVTTPRRTMRARLFAYLWTNRAYLGGWADGFIFGVAVCAAAVALMGLK